MIVMKNKILTILSVFVLITLTGCADYLTYEETTQSSTATIPNNYEIVSGGYLEGQFGVREVVNNDTGERFLVATDQHGIGITQIK